MGLLRAVRKQRQQMRAERLDDLLATQYDPTSAVRVLRELRKK
ncbi:hypothetical protein [Xanthomonas albilineans]|nr:hypothetical protein [Xanthomonas albilineans]